MGSEKTDSSLCLRLNLSNLKFASTNTIYLQMCVVNNCTLSMETCFILCFKVTKIAPRASYKRFLKKIFFAMNYQYYEISIISTFETVLNCNTT